MALTTSTSLEAEDRMQSNSIVRLGTFTCAPKYIPDWILVNLTWSLITLESLMSRTLLLFKRETSTNLNVTLSSARLKLEKFPLKAAFEAAKKFSHFCLFTSVCLTFDRKMKNALSHIMVSWNGFYSLKKSSSSYVKSFFFFINWGQQPLRLICCYVYAVFNFIYFFGKLLKAKKYFQ